mmetsp:Transcript_38992/g.121456  ORF Transcript_38992/g.121456 Transcript_38992/m.121456 type:complete len:217 (+) Transcript_38992:375-1025(+)
MRPPLQTPSLGWPPVKQCLQLSCAAPQPAHFPALLLYPRVPLLKLNQRLPPGRLQLLATPRSRPHPTLQRSNRILPNRLWLHARTQHLLQLLAQPRCSGLELHEQLGGRLELIPYARELIVLTSPCLLQLLGLRLGVALRGPRLRKLRPQSLQLLQLRAQGFQLRRGTRSAAVLPPHNRSGQNIRRFSKRRRHSGGRLLGLRQPLLQRQPPLLLLL